jgi:hypothetical protein
MKSGVDKAHRTRRPWADFNRFVGAASAICHRFLPEVIFN